MRRSAAILSLCAFLALAAPPISRAAPTLPAGAALTVGIFTDPATIAGVTMWAVDKLVRLMEFADELADHLKEDVRRASQPHGAPRVAPVPAAPDMLPAPRRLPPRVRAPEPIIDSLPARSIS